MPSIVTVNVTTTQAPTPNTLQQMAAFVSQGATNTTPGTYTLLTSLSSLTPIINGSKAVTSIAQTAGTATVTTTSAHGFTSGDTLYITIAGATPAAYNGTFLCTVTGTSTFTYAVPSGTSSPASGTIVYTVEDVAELNQMATTWFAQGSNAAVYVLELGPGNPTDGATFLTTWLTANPQVFYSILVPRTWDGNATFLTLIASYEGTTALLYFWVTTTLANYTKYTSLMKCVRSLIETPAYGAWAANALTALSETGTTVSATTTSAHGVAVGQWFQISGCSPTGYNGWKQAITGTTGSTLVWTDAGSLGAETVLGTLVQSQYTSAGIGANEFSMAALMYVQTAYTPSSAYRVPPFAFSYVYGVTPFPTQGNGALLTTLKAANTNVIGTGAEGGISNTIVLWGTGEDGTPINYWYQIDWLNLNINLRISNAVINGSNNTQAPLYLNQDGVNALQAVGAATLSSGITYGLIFGQVLQTELSGAQFALNVQAGLYAGYAVINAVPFATYYAASPSDYSIGKYAGFSVAFTPQNGFTQITFNLNATQFV